MTPEKLMDAIGEVDEALLSKTEKGAMVSPRRLTSFLAVAACFCLIVGAGVMANRSGIFDYKAEGPVAEEAAPIEEAAPVEEAAEEPAAEEPAAVPEEAEPPAYEPGEELDVVLVDAGYYIDASFYEWLDDTCEDNALAYKELTPEELCGLLETEGRARLVIVNEANWDFADYLAQQYPEINICTPEQAQSGALTDLVS